MKEKVVPIELVKKGRYKNPTEMIRDLSQDETTADRTIREMNERCVIDFLMARRSAIGFSQTDIAREMECTQSRVSKLENGKDDDLRIGDFRDYVQALGLNLTFVLSKKDMTIVDRVRQHVFSIRNLLFRLVSLAGDDREMRSGTRLFFNQVLQNSVNAILEASDKLTSNLASANENQLLAKIPNEPPLTIQGDTEAHSLRIAHS